MVMRRIHPEQPASGTAHRQAAVQQVQGNRQDGVAGRFQKRCIWMLKKVLRLPVRVRGVICRVKEHGLRLTADYILERFCDALGIGDKKNLSPLPGLNHTQRSPRILVSLAIHADEIDSAARTINTLLRQTVRPDRLILHLYDWDAEQKQRPVPNALARCLRRGVELRRCEDAPVNSGRLALWEEEADAIIVTASGGFFFRAEMIERLSAAYRRNPDMIHCHRAQKIRSKADDGGSAGLGYDPVPSYLNQPCIGEGCLFPPRALSGVSSVRERVFDFSPADEDTQFWLLALSKDRKINVVDRPLLRAPAARAIQNRASSALRPLALKNLDDVCAAFPEWALLLRREEAEMKRVEQARSIPQEQKTYDYYRTLETPMYRAELCLWYQNTTHKRLDLDHPETYNEKIQWLKLYDSTAQKALLTDKYAVRDWVAQRVGSEYLVPLLGVWDRFEDIDFSRLPNRFVLKATHGCGWNILVPDKSKFDRDKAEESMNRWLQTNFAFQNGLELNYKTIRPRIIAEEFLENGGGDLFDYKFWCFEGKVHYIMFLSERKRGLKMIFFNRDWERVDLSYEYPRNKNEIPKPPQIDRMIELSERLSAGLNHCRVDFYLLDNGEIKFGELTFSAASGSQRWDPPEADRMLGRLFSLPEASPTP